MSDISKKIFSIDPEPDEGPMAHVPVPEDLSEESPGDTPELRGAPVPKVPVFRPILDLIDIEDDTPDEIDTSEASDADRMIEEAEPPKLTLRPVAIDTPSDDHTHSTEESQSETPRALPDEASDIVMRSGAIRPIAESASIEPVAASAILTPSSRSTPDVVTGPSLPVWIGPVLAVLTALAVGFLVYAYASEVEAISPVGLAALILAVLVPTLTVALFWVGLRAFSNARQETLRLEAAATRLTTPTDAVAQDAERLVDHIKSQLSHLTHRLQATHAEAASLQANIANQAGDLDALTTRITERSRKAVEDTQSQIAAFDSASRAMDVAIENASTKIGQWQSTLTVSGERVGADLQAITERLEAVFRSSEQERNSIALASQALAETVAASDTSLLASAETLTSSASALDNRLSAQVLRLSDLSRTITAKDTEIDGSLAQRVDDLTRLDAEVDEAEQRLLRLLNRATDVRDEMMARLAEIETAMQALDDRSRTALSQPPSLSIETVKPTREEPDFADSTPNRETSPSQPLDLATFDDTDLTIPDEPLDAPLELKPVDEPLPLAPKAADVVRRPGGDTSGKTPFGRAKGKNEESGGWRWRDMLGGIDAESSPTIDPEPQPAFQRPPAGVPLSPPPPPPELPDGSDVVARLCEVKLAPSAIVDEGTIIDATAARLTGGEARQVDLVVARLNPPVDYLRGILSRDLEFKLRAESFRRSFDAHLSRFKASGDMRAELSTASGRAYLLCAAALRTS